MNNQTIINNIIDNNSNAPAEILNAFRGEANESGYDLATKEGTDWYANRSVLAEWHRKNNAAERKARTVEFSWSYEEVGNGEFVKNVDVDGIEVANLHEFMQDNGLPATRALVKKLARKAGKIFIETTDLGMGRDFAFARITAINEARSA